jgi:hypothetical protein
VDNLSRAGYVAPVLTVSRGEPMTVAPQWYREITNKDTLA